MKRMKTLLIVSMVALTSPLFPVRPAFAQDAPQTVPREADPIAALTAEFRALRAELSTAAAASLRLQLLVARIQAQEQRILYLDRVRVEAATRRTNAEQARNQFANQMTMRDLTGAEMTNLAPEEQRRIERHIDFEKTQLALQDRTVLQMQADENDAVNALALEQGRWNDFNARLDELDRSLSQK
jgi:hypothetical protein